MSWGENGPVAENEAGSKFTQTSICLLHTKIIHHFFILSYTAHRFIMYRMTALGWDVEGKTVPSALDLKECCFPN